MAKKILILGGGGMLGHKLYQVLDQSFNVFATIRGSYPNYERFGIFQREKIVENVNVDEIPKLSEIIEEIRPDFIINSIGIIKQLPDSKKYIESIKINALLPHQIAEIADKFRSKLITISTDCVFNGKKGMYSEEDLPDANDLYGKTKNLGEVSQGNHLTIRTSIIGRELSTDHSLIEWFLSNVGKKVKGFTNAIYTGFPTVVLSRIIAEIILKNENLKGLFHISSDPINKYELLVLVKSYFGVDIEIEKFPDFEIDRSLDSTKFRRTTGFQPQTWDEMIKEMAEDAKLYKNWR